MGTEDLSIFSSLYIGLISFESLIFSLLSLEGEYAKVADSYSIRGFIVKD